MNHEPMTNEREARIIDEEIVGCQKTVNAVDLAAIRVFSSLISALVETGEKGKHSKDHLRKSMAEAYVLLEALELVHGDVSDEEIEFLEFLDDGDVKEAYDDD